MNLSQILSENSSKTAKLVWNYNAIYDNNVNNCANEFKDKNEFLSLKASSQTKKAIRVVLRKKIDALNETFLKSTDKTEKLQTAQKIKIFTDSLGGKERVNLQSVNDFLTANQKTEKQKEK